MNIRALCLLACAALAGCDRQAIVAEGGITSVPPAHVQHQYFVECMRLAPPAEGSHSREGSVAACEKYSFRVASQEGTHSIPVTVKQYQ